MNSQTKIQKLLKIPVDNTTYTDIHKAVIKGNLKRVKLYLDRGPGPWGTVDSLDWWGRTPLYRAVDKNNVPIVIEILTQGATVDLREKLWWRTPLHLACDKGYLECVRHLLAYDATVDISAKEGWTPLMLAAANGHTEIVQMLLNVKANYKLRTKNDFQALHHAAKNNHADIVHLLLLQKNSDPNIRIYEKGPTALHIAAEHNSANAVDVLLSHDAEVNCRDKQGWAPLHLAVYNGALEATHALISHYSCDLHIKNNEDQEALDLCLQKFRTSAPTRRMQQTLAYVRKAYSNEAAEQKPDLVAKADYGRGEVDLQKNPNVLEKSPTKEKIDSMEPSQRLRSLVSNLKGISTRFRDFIAADLRRRNQQGVKEKTAVVSTIEDALANANQCIDVCKAMSRSNKAAMITALATENGDYDVDEDEMESLRDAKNIDMGEKKKERWRNGWKEDRLLYLQTLELHVENLDLKLAGKADGLSAPKWTKRFAKLWQVLKNEYHWSSRPGSQRETLKKGEWVMTRLDHPLRHVAGAPEIETTTEGNEENEKFAYKTQIHYRYGDGTYLVRFGTGEKKHVRRDQIDLIETKKMGDSFDTKGQLPFGTMVMVQLKDWDRAYEGYIVRINTDGTYDVKFMDGSKEQYLERTQMRKKPHPVPYYYFLPGALVSSGKEGVDYFTREEHVIAYVAKTSRWAVEAINDSRRRELRIEKLSATLSDRDAEIERLKALLEQRNETIVIAGEVERLLTPTQKRSSNYRAVRKVFTELDVDGDGELTAEEILTGLKGNAAVIKLVKSIPELAPLADPEIYGDAFDTMDVDGNGGVSLQEFMKFRQKLQDIRVLFRILDKDQDGYVSKPEFKYLVAHLKSRPKVKRLFHKHPELKELMALKTFERAWEELHMKKPSCGVSLGELLLFSRKVGLVRRVFELLPKANDQGDVLKDVFIMRSKDEDVRLLLQKDDDLRSLSNGIDEARDALNDISATDTISLDEVLRFSRKVASLRIVMENSVSAKAGATAASALLQKAHRRMGGASSGVAMERSKFLLLLATNEAGKDAKQKGAGVKDVLQRHPELAYLATSTAYHDSFRSTCGDVHGYVTLSDVMIFTRKVSVAEEVLQEIVAKYGGVPGLVGGKNGSQAPLRSGGIKLEDRTMVPLVHFFKAVKTRNKIRRSLSKVHALKVLLEIRSVQNIVVMSSFAVDGMEQSGKARGGGVGRVLDGNILINVCDDIGAAQKLAKDIVRQSEAENSEVSSANDATSIAPGQLMEHVRSTSFEEMAGNGDNGPLKASLRALYAYLYGESERVDGDGMDTVPPFLKMAFPSLQARYRQGSSSALEKGITVEELAIAGKRIHCLDEIFKGLVKNSDETGFTPALLLNFIKEQCDHPFVKKYYQYSNADDAIFSPLETLNEHADLLELLIKTRPFRPFHILRFAHGVHFLQNDLFPLLTSKKRDDVFRQLKSDSMVREMLAERCPVDELRCMVETEEFKAEFHSFPGASSNEMSVHEFYKFGLIYHKAKIEFVRQVKKHFIDVAFNENCKVKFENMVEKGDSAKGTFTVRTFIRAVESLRVKGNEPLKRLHEFIGENKKKIRRCMNRLFLEPDPGDPTGEWHAIQKKEFYEWLKGSIVARGKTG